MQKWKIIDDKEVIKAAIFRYSKRKLESPDSGMSGDFDIVSCANWVNILAISSEGELLMVRQYRAGADEVTIELPAGAVEAGEDPLLAAKRELCEETGFTSAKWLHLGDLKVNPAFMTNTCHIYLARECTCTHELGLDELEEIEVYKIPLSEGLQLFRAGEITHSLSVASLALAFLKGQLT